MGKLQKLSREFNCRLMRKVSVKRGYLLRWAAAHVRQLSGRCISTFIPHESFLLKSHWESWFKIFEALFAVLILFQETPSGNTQKRSVKTR